MVEHGSTFLNYNSELISCVQTLKFKRDELFRSMNLEEIEKSQITEEIQKLNERLSAITASLKLKSEAMNEYDRAIQESEMEFSKLMQSTEDTYRNVKRNYCRLGFSEQRSTSQIDQRSSSQLEPRSNSQLEPRSNIQLELRSNIQLDPRSTIQLDPRSTIQLDPRSTIQLDPRSSIQVDPRSTIQLDPRSTIQLDPRSNSQLEPRSNITLEPRSNSQLEPRSNSQLDPRESRGKSPSRGQCCRVTCHCSHRRPTT